MSEHKNLEIVKLISQGLNNKAICEKLEISKVTLYRQLQAGELQKILDDECKLKISHVKLLFFSNLLRSQQFIARELCNDDTSIETKIRLVGYLSRNNLEFSTKKL